MSIKNSKFGTFLGKHSNSIWTAIAIFDAGMALVNCVKGTKEALAKVDALREQKAEKENKSPDEIVLSKKDIFKTTWKCYIPTGMYAVASVISFIIPQASLRKDVKNLTAKYNLALNGLKEYKNFKEILAKENGGEEIVRKTQDCVDVETLRENESSISDVIVLDADGILWHDPYLGRNFKANLSRVEKGLNTINRLIGVDGAVPLAEFYDNIDMPHSTLTDMFWWDANTMLYHDDILSEVWIYEDAEILTNSGEPYRMLRFTFDPFYKDELI